MKRKFLLLLVAILCLTMTATACGNKAEPDSAGGGVNPPASLIVPQTPVDHAIREYFDLVGDAETVQFTKALQYDGELIGYDEDYHLIALENKDLDNYNKVIETVTVYDYSTNEKLFEHKVENLLYADAVDSVELEVTISYPVIRVSEKSYGEDSREIYDVSYYFAKKDSTCIHTTDRTEFDRVDFQNGLVAFEMGDRIFWVDRNMEVVRSVDAIAAGGYELNEDSFDSEFQGYLYSLERDIVRVFNHSGVCSATYELAHDGFLNTYVINNGFVLIQDLKEVDGSEAYDFKLYEDFYDMTSYLMNPVDGSLKELQLDFYVNALETRYAEKYADNNRSTYIQSAFPFDLAINRDNQAYIYRFANGKLSTEVQYVALNNELAVEYTVKNDTKGITFAYGGVLNPNYYVAFVAERGGSAMYVFDLDGNAVMQIAESALYDDFYITDKYVVAMNGIYDHKLNLLYDLQNNEDDVTLLYVDPSIDKIYLSKNNYETGYVDIYYFNPATHNPTLLIAGAEAELCSTMMNTYGVYITKTEWDTKSDIFKYTYYNMEGTPLLVLYGNEYLVSSNKDALIVETTFEGESIVYVLQ